MTELTNSERETHFNIAADNRGECEIFTDDAVWRARLEKWFVPYKTQGDGAWFRVPTSAVIRERALLRGTEVLKSLSESGSVTQCTGSEPQTMHSGA